MIRSWANSATRRLHEEGRSRKFRGLEAALELLAIVDAATSLQDLSPLKSAGLHKLKGDRRGQWAMKWAALGASASGSSAVTLMASRSSIITRDEL
jgi:proteic killer suppression protein